MKTKGWILMVAMVAVLFTATNSAANSRNDTDAVIRDILRLNNEINFFANPNPFYEYTVISVGMNAPTFATVIIEDSSGNVVKELFEGILVNGMNDFYWFGENERGDRLEPGLYSCRFETGNRYTSRTIILILK